MRLGLGLWLGIGKSAPPAPTVSAISPALGDASGGVSVTITGSHFQAGSGVSAVTIGGVACTSVVVVNDTTITAVTPAKTASSSGVDVVATGPGGNGTLAGGYVSWWPTLLTGILCWLRADLGVTNVSGAASAWADQSGAGDSNRNQSQSNATFRPAINATDAAYNNNPSLSFNHAVNPQRMASGTWSVAPGQPSTWWVVGNYDGSTRNQAFLDDISVYNLVETHESGVGPDIYAGSSLQAGVADFSTPALIGGIFNGNSSKVFVNARTAKASGAAGVTAATGLTVGSTHSGAASLQGKIAEVVICSGVMSAGDIDKLSTYVTGRYGISVGS